MSLSNEPFLPKLIQTIDTNTNIININIRLGGYVILNLNNDVDCVYFHNWPENLMGRITLEIRNTASYVIKSYNSVLWLSGMPETSSGLGTSDLLLFHSGDSGKTIYGNIIGLDYRRQG